MRQRILLSLIGSLCLFLLSCSSESHGAESNETDSTRTDGRPHETIEEVPFERWPSFYRDAYRIGPDRRFLAAFRDVQQLLSGDESKPVAASFRDGRWHLTDETGEAIGSLSEFPTYREEMTLLREWANRFAKGSKKRDGRFIDGVCKKVDGFDAPSLLAALRSADSRWSELRHDERLRQCAARALVHLRLQTLDQVDLADALDAKAMAMLALSPGTLAEEALLASLMSYEADAIELSGALPEDHTVRAFVTRDTKRLEALVARPETTALDRFLHAFSLGITNAPVEAYDWARRNDRDSDFDLPRFALQIDHTEFSETREIAQESQRNTLVEILPKKRKVKIDGNRAKEFEARLNEVTSTDAAILDHTTLHSYFGANFYSPLYVEMDFYLSSLSSAPAAKRFLEGLSNVEESYFESLRRWGIAQTEHAMGSRISDQNVLQILRDVAGAGGSRLYDLIESADETLTNAAHVRRELTRFAFERLDSRPSFRYYAGELAFNQLRDLRLSEKYYEAGIAAFPSGQSRLQAWYYALTGDIDRLQQLIDRPSIEPWRRSRALEVWSENLPPEFVEDRFTRLTAEDPDRINFLTGYLEEQKQWTRLEKVASEWIEKNPDAERLSISAMSGALAHAQQELGRPAEAWGTIEPWISTWQQIAMERGALVLEALERYDDAIALATRAVKRYGDGVHSRAVLARILWRRERYAEAAQVLNSKTNRLGRSSMYREAYPAFEETFVGQPREKSRAAFRAFLDQREDLHFLSSLAHAFRDSDPELGFELIQLVIEREKEAPERGPYDALAGFRDVAYDLLKVWKGEEAATEWLFSMIPESSRPGAIAGWYQDEDYALLWSVAPPPGQRKQIELEFIKVLAALRMRLPSDDPKLVAAREYFAPIDPAELRNSDAAILAALAKYLLDQSPLSALLEHATNPNYRCTTAYVIGVKLAHEGRYEEASDWLQASIETGLARNPVHAWAIELVSKWFSRGKTFTAIAADGIL